MSLLKPFTNYPHLKHVIEGISSFSFNKKKTTLQYQNEFWGKCLQLLPPRRLQRSVPKLRNVPPSFRLRWTTGTLPTTLGEFGTRWDWRGKVSIKSVQFSVSPNDPRNWLHCEETTFQIRKGWLIAHFQFPGFEVNYTLKCTAKTIKQIWSLCSHPKGILISNTSFGRQNWPPLKIVDKSWHRL